MLREKDEEIIGFLKGEISAYGVGSRSEKALEDAGCDWAEAGRKTSQSSLGNHSKNQENPLFLQKANQFENLKHPSLPIRSFEVE